MKKNIVLSFALIILFFLLTGCGSNNNSSSTSKTPTIILSASSASSGTVTLSWSSSDGNTYQAFVYEKTSKGYVCITNISPNYIYKIYESVSSPYIVSGLTSNQTYYFYVLVCDISFSSNVTSNVISITTE